MITFKPSMHMMRDGNVEVMEIWVDFKMVAVLYPQPPNTVRLISRHIRRTSELPSTAPLRPLMAIHEFEFYP
jgi:hypothetical protein